MKKILLPLLITLCLTVDVAAQEIPEESVTRFSSRGWRFMDPENDWIDSVMNTLTLEQRIAQLMVVRVPS